MRFSFEESELINNLFGDTQELLSKDSIIEKLESAKTYTPDTELIAIANTTIEKIKSLDERTFENIFRDYPINVNPYINY